MLERFDKVAKLGLFDDYNHTADCEFGQVTLIYGENGVGKSTLAAVLDSLRERNATELVRRRSLPGDKAPTIAVRLNGQDYYFNGHDWNSQPPHDTLDVFYPGFITRNVHAWTGIAPDHKRNLCELVLGRKAVENVNKLAKADHEGRNALTEINSIERQLSLLVKQPDTLKTFLDLPIDPQVDEKILQVRGELKDAQSKDAILAKTVPKEVDLPGIDHSSISQILEQSLEEVKVDIAARVKVHIRDYLDSEGETWLAYGAKHLGEDGKCPFCEQNTDNSQLVAAIRSYFNTSYSRFTQSLAQAIQKLYEVIGTEVFTKIQASINHQVATAMQWSDVRPIDQSMIGDKLSEAEAAWKNGASKLGALIATKKENPLEKIEGSTADEAIREYESALVFLSDLNSILTDSANKAEEQKSNLTKTKTVDIQERLIRLENQKRRYERDVQDLIEKRTALIEMRQKIDEEKTSLKKEIEENASRVIGKYQEGINHYLEHFGCDIRIDAVQPRFPGGRASVQYKLKVHGYEIELGLSDSSPCFETVLSDGDKNMLALSFFFARLKDYASLTGRTIILDDPVNSLGSSRRSLVKGVMCDLYTRGAQVVVLTHDERLAAMLWYDKALRNPVPLQVQRTRSGSSLKQWDIESAMQTEYVENYLTLVDYLENGGDHRKAAACIRPYVEQRLRYLVPGPPLHSRDSLGVMIGRIRESPPGSRLANFKNVLPHLEAINVAALPSHHASDDAPSMQPLSPDEVRIFAQKALDVLG